MIPVAFSSASLLADKITPAPAAWRQVADLTPGVEKAVRLRIPDGRNTKRAGHGDGFAQQLDQSLANALVGNPA